MRLAWNKTSLVLTVTKEEAFEIRKALPIPVSRYRLIPNKRGMLFLVPDGTGNELKDKPKSNGSDEVVFQTALDASENALPRFYSMDLPAMCVTLREDGKGLLLNVGQALAMRPAELPYGLSPAKGAKPASHASKGAKRATTAKSEHIPTPDWIEDRMSEAEDVMLSSTRVEQLQQADFAILEGLLKRINGLRRDNKMSVSFVIQEGGYVGLKLASKAVISCKPRDL